MTNNPTIDGVSLLPCPFCGGEPYGTHDHYVHDDMSPMPCVECRSCSAHLKADDWNRRVKSPSQQSVEPVAWQIRSRTDRPESVWTEWRECSAIELAMHSHEVGKYNRFGIMREIRSLYLDQPEVADLQAAIAQQAARIAELERGQREPPAYKPGLYAVRHIDNWDGERDVVLTFAMLDADGKWTDKETGEPLLTFKGDKVLRAWPLDCPDSPGAQIIGVPRNWLEEWAIELVEAAQDGGQMSNQVEHLLEIHAKP
ncbi:Lar family restriction alleviation protein [Pseudomonas sp. R16(2017)]|uniref:Lar family restriction alleviation protein n=1 Tax=Pseudomonas sp. R16(2017) TaxID=1981704 RepID=UPI0021148AD7|nr:Lar family restriction alleviation protein [Pseudomonas sp. R16(2017)]